MVPADSRRIPRVPRYSGARSPRLRVSPRGLSPSAARLSSRFGYAPPLASARVLQPRRRLDAGGLGSCAFARHYLRNHCYFLFLRVLRCFSSPRSPPRVARMTGSLPPGFPIRTSPGRCAFAAHRRFSQLVTSFVASESHRHPPCALVRLSFLSRSSALSALSRGARTPSCCKNLGIYLLSSLRWPLDSQFSLLADFFKKLCFAFPSCQ